jgi:hypothetical protein
MSIDCDPQSCNPGWCLKLKEFSLRPLRISAFSALNSNLNAEDAEIRREDLQINHH